MPTYKAINRPRSQWDIWERPATVQTSMTVYERDDEPENTGLVDANGTPLYRMPEKRKIGFL